jgi:hypothetical protein
MQSTMEFRQGRAGGTQRRLKQRTEPGQMMSSASDDHFNARLEQELASWRIVAIDNRALGRSAVIRIRIARPDIPHLETFRTAVEVFWRYDDISPASDSNERQIAFERALDDVSFDNGFSELMQVSTDERQKTWLFYTADGRRFMKAVNQLLSGHERYPVRIFLTDDPQWSIWNAAITDLEPCR